MRIKEQETCVTLQEHYDDDDDDDNDNYNLRATLSPVQSSSLLTGTDLGVAKYF